MSDKENIPQVPEAPKQPTPEELQKQKELEESVKKKQDAIKGNKIIRK